MHHPTDWITHTTAFVTPVVEHWLERETSMIRNEYNNKQVIEKQITSDNRFDVPGMVPAMISTVDAGDRA